MFSLGINSAVNRYIPHYNATKENDKIEIVINTSLVFYIFSSIMFLLATSIIYFNLTNWFTIPDYLHSVSKILVLIVGIGFAAIIPLNLFSAVLSSYQRYDIINIGIFVHVIVRALLLIILVLKGFRLIAIGIVFALTEIGLKTIYFYYAKKLIGGKLKFSKASIDFRLLKEMIGYGINTFLFTISAVAIYRASDMIIGIFRKVEDITKYSVITVLILVLHQLLQAFLSVITAH